MGELRAKRPASMTSFGRNMSHDDRSHRTDEESLLEEQARLRTQLGALRREGAEAKERLRAAERDSLRKDKLLQELLATAKGGPGVLGEALDQLREDLQALLQVKRRAQEARQQLDEKELKIAAIQQELKATSILDMEEDVAAAKMECKTKAEEWKQENSEGRDTQCYSESLKHQREARDLFQKIVGVENDISKSQQRLVRLQDERNRLEETVEDHSEQVEKLAEKRQEIQRQKEQCEERLAALGDVAEQHVRMKQSCDELFEKVEKARQDVLAQELQNSALRGRAALNAVPPSSGVRNAAGRPVSDCRIDERLLSSGFQPLLDNASLEAQRLLQLMRVCSEIGQVSLLKVMQAEDGDADGRLTAAELSKVFKKLASVGGCLPPEADLSENAASFFMASLRAGLAPEQKNKQGEMTMAIPDLVLALPMQQLNLEKSLGPEEDQQIRSASQALAWACRRCGMPERDLRRRLVACIQPAAARAQQTPPSPSFGTGCGPRVEMAKLEKEVGLGTEEARTLALALECRREGIARLLPSWRSLSDKSQAALLVRFVHDLAKFRDTLLPLLGQGVLSLEEFLKAGQQLGPHWSRHDLEEIALLAEAAELRQPGEEVRHLPPRVDIARLTRACMPGGLAAEFPAAARACQTDTLEACEAAARAPSRRAQPPVPAAAVSLAGSERLSDGPAPPPPPAPPPASAAPPVVHQAAPPAAPAPPAPPAAPTAPASGPAPPAPPAAPPAEGAGGDEEAYSEEEFDDEFVEESVDEESGDEGDD